EQRTVAITYSGWIPVFIGSPLGRRGRRLGDLGQELVVALGRLYLVHQQLETGGAASLAPQGVEHPPELPHLLELGALEEQLLVTGGGRVHVEGRVDPALGQLAVEAQLHVAGALELLEDHLVHAGTSLDQRRRQDGQRAAFLDIPGRAEEILGGVQRSRVDTTRQDPARRRGGQVVGAGQTGDAVEDDDDVPAHLHEALGP